VVDTLVLHYTGMRSAEDALERLCDPAAKVSAHWLIDEDGALSALVDEEARACHAGVSWWQGREGLNATSIGIELVNPGHEWGYRPFPPAQMRSLIALCHGILTRWPIPPARVLGHADIAPERKEDPGELFDWRLLAREGLALWPEPDPAPLPDTPGLQAALARIGYRVPRTGGFDPATRRVIVAFQRHFRPARVDGVLDPETWARIRGLLAITP
jgi:N-acetylmuramoyl-L-alanine amidase